MEKILCGRLLKNEIKTCTLLTKVFNLYMRLCCKQICYHSFLLYMFRNSRSVVSFHSSAHAHTAIKLHNHKPSQLSKILTNLLAYSGSSKILRSSRSCRGWTRMRTIARLLQQPCIMVKALLLSNIREFLSLARLRDGIS